MKIDLIISKETKDLLDALIWFFEPTNIVTSSSKDYYSLYRSESCSDEPKELSLTVKN